MSAKAILQAIKTLHPEPGTVFEVRVLGSFQVQRSSSWEGFAGGAKAIISGYFNDPEKAAQLVERIDREAKPKGVYVTLNPVPHDFLARANNRFKVAQTTTADKDIARRVNVCIDLDPERNPKDISSTDEEKAKALALSNEVKVFLASLGWPEPVEADSGNGYHLIYVIDLPNDEDATKLIENVLKALAGLFNTDAVKVDATMFNASRICKLYGTTARKGDSTEDRPHRMARVISQPAARALVTREQLEEVAALAPPDEQPKPSLAALSAAAPHGGQKFDVKAYLEEHGRTVVKVKPHGTSTLYVLDECPFDPTHTSGESAIGQCADGKLFFHCYHNSCKGKTWHDARPIISGNSPLMSRNAPGTAGAAEAAELSSPAWAGHPELLRINRFLDTPAPEIDYVLKDAIPKRAVTLLNGPSGSMKTTLGQNTTLAVATPLPALQGLFEVQERGAVLYINGEDPEPIIHRHFRRRFEHERDMREAFDCMEDWPEVERCLRENIYVVSCAGSCAHLARANRDNILEPTPLFEQLLETARAIPNLVLVIMDTKSRLFPGQEKDNDQSAQVIGLLERFCKATGCAVLLVHHVTKASQNGDKKARDAWKGPLDPTASRGGSALLDNARAGIAMVRVPEGVARSNGHSGDQPLVCIRVNKNNYGRDGHEVWAVRTQAGGLAHFEHKGVKDEPELLEKTVVRVVEDIRTAPDGQMLERDVWRDRSKVYKAEKLLVTQNDVQAAISEAVKRGLLKKEIMKNPANGKDAGYLILAERAA